MKGLALILLILSSSDIVLAQRYSVQSSEISFFSSAPIEDIAALNKKSIGLFDASSNKIAFSVPIREFVFPKSLMQEHFNEKYMESDKYPNSTFSGIVQGFDITQKGSQRVTAEGKLTIHGVTHDVKLEGTIEVGSKDKLNLKSKFQVKVADYNITIPQLLWQNIAEVIDVTAEFNFKPD